MGVLSAEFHVMLNRVFCEPQGVRMCIMWTQISIPIFVSESDEISDLKERVRTLEAGAVKCIYQYISLPLLTTNQA
jgi:hypothetical protein